MVGKRSLLWVGATAWCALFNAVKVAATLQDPVMWILAHHDLKQARIDPIVSPGKVSSHVHSLVGANGVSADTTTARDLEEASNCTTSGILADMSAYWAPTLYSFNGNDTFTPRPLYYVNTYYLMRGNVPITAYPRGLQLLAGNATRTGPGPTTQADNIVSFVCLNYAQGSSQHPTLPPGPCPQGLRTQIVFPSCWNGEDLVSANHSHVVYPLGDNADNGLCPDTHNVRLPTLFYEFVWGVDDQDNTGNSSWVFSNGDAIGYSFHADFIAAWNETILQNAIDECAGNLFNNLESCPPLAETLDRDASEACSATSTEAKSGSIESLPGCNVIWNGPHAGKGLTKGCDPSNVMLKPAGWRSALNSTTTSASTARTISTASAATTTSSMKTLTNASVTGTAASAASHHEISTLPTSTRAAVALLPKAGSKTQSKSSHERGKKTKKNNEQGVHLKSIPKPSEKKKHRSTLINQKKTKNQEKQFEMTSNKKSSKK
ncbi:uncharacterized protein MEPE_06217 [Melanopsichium pennsylvanicum]|uniref:DUF1996 domain-containing protein n=2 Tax=Melanopsichium pennsylvanicum TaxID=63383 RepID=A0AAJ4XTA5_9BASI|nr:conserved hypothetical protein [Melanopsichium pennsylvanicum 4]SNX87507.1 uncharacterized protein MEPE_06217 [Melanopsichium pennsylvanicum]